jgi:toxin ParE1/3/4
VKVYFTDAANEQLDHIYAYIAADSPHYAKRVIDRILQKANNIGIMPRAAAIVPEYSRPDIREVFAYRYRVIYRILTDRIDVLAVVHGAKPLPERFDELA